MPDLFLKKENAVKDYKFDLKGVTNGSIGAEKDWLESAEIISSYTVTVPAGITKDSDSKTDSDTSVTVWLSGGTYTAGATTTYCILLNFVTSSGREDDVFMTIEMEAACE